MAAAAKDKQRNNDDPTAVIAKKITKAVIHKISLLKAVSGSVPLPRYHSMSGGSGCARKLSKYLASARKNGYLGG